MGIDCIRKTFTPEGSDEEICAKFWDTKGNIRQKGETIRVLKTADGVVIMFDIGRPETFASVLEWYEHVRSECSPGVPVMLVGNKSDLPMHAVTTGQA